MVRTCSLVSQSIRALHDSKTEPLHPDLRDPQQPSRTLKGADRLATRDVCARSWQRDDVGKGACSGCCAEQDKDGRDALGGATTDDAVMLGKVGDDDAEEKEAERVSLKDISEEHRRGTQTLIGLD